MPATRRIQLLMESAEFRKLQAVARRRRTSVAELIRLAVRETYLSPVSERRPAVEAILAMAVPVVDWKRTKKDIEAAHMYATPPCRDNASQRRDANLER